MMKNFSKCPSCQAQGEIRKDGFYTYQHKSFCKMGKIIGDEKCLCGGRCTACGSINGRILKYEEYFTPNQKDIENGLWLAPYECPICWAIAEANEQALIA